jgi:hypothetical protein
MASSALLKHVGSLSAANQARGSSGLWRTTACRVGISPPSQGLLPRRWSPGEPATVAGYVARPRRIHPHRPLQDSVVLID